jgi:gliding motility-associated-like protein
MNAQNLVLNPSFEQVNTCPFGSTGYAVSDQCINWCGLNTAEVAYNACNVGTFPSVPYDGAGGGSFQYARTGNCYVSFPTTYKNFSNSVIDTNYKGYVQGKLSNTLITGKKYCVSFYVNLVNECQIATDKTGALLHANPYTCNVFPRQAILANPQVVSASGIIYKDTLLWENINGIFIANGTEKYISIGNFSTYNQLNIQWINPSGTLYGSDYNIDDVSVEELKDALCKGDTNICKGDSVLIGINETENATYNWLPTNGLSCANCASPKASPSSNITYTLTKQQCSYISTAKINITVKDCNPTIEIPNVFTPNGDGINDTFNFSIVGASDVSFMIYNRWGNIIKNSTLITNTYILWDGHTTSGEACSEGIYFYTLQYTDSKGDVVNKKGFITLMK